MKAATFNTAGKYFLYGLFNKKCWTDTLFSAENTSTQRMCKEDGEIFLAEGCFDSWDQAKQWRESLDIQALYKMRLLEHRKNRRAK